MPRTFLDAGVLIAPIRGTPEIADRALELLNGPERLFVSSDFVRLTEFITVEHPGKPLFRVKGLTVRTLLNP